MNMLDTCDSIDVGKIVSLSEKKEKFTDFHQKETQEQSSKNVLCVELISLGTCVISSPKANIDFIIPNFWIPPFRVRVYRVSQC